MKDNYKLEKEYRMPIDIFREAYKAYQKKFERTKSMIFTALFLVLAADFVYAAVKSPDNRLVYLLIVVCIAMAFREWYNPYRKYQAYSEIVKDMGDVTYKIGIADDHIDIETLDPPDEEEIEDISTDDEDDELPDDYDPAPEKNTIQLSEDYRLIEYERFFLLLDGKAMFYILPKEGFSEEELNIVRGTMK